jgi:hypothetical protein
MDLNQLLHQQQIALINATFAVHDSRAGSRFDLVEHYGRRIRALREKLGVSQYPDWVTGPPPWRLNQQ